MGIDVSEDAGWLHNKGLRIYGGGMRLEIPWPELGSYPGYGLVRPRQDFDDILARQAVKAGARLIEAHQTSRVPYSTTTAAWSGSRLGTPRQRTRQTYRAPIVIAADGVSARLALALGLRKRDDRPMGVAYRRYYTEPAP